MSEISPIEREIVTEIIIQLSLLLVAEQKIIFEKIENNLIVDGNHYWHRAHEIRVCIKNCKNILGGRL